MKWSRVRHICLTLVCAGWASLYGSCNMNHVTWCPPLTGSVFNDCLLAIEEQGLNHSLEKTAVATAQAIPVERYAVSNKSDLRPKWGNVTDLSRHLSNRLDAWQVQTLMYASMQACQCKVSGPVLFDWDPGELQVTINSYYRKQDRSLQRNWPIAMAASLTFVTAASPPRATNQAITAVTMMA